MENAFDENLVKTFELHMIRYNDWSEDIYKFKFKLELTNSMILVYYDSQFLFSNENIQETREISDLYRESVENTIN